MQIPNGMWLGNPHLQFHYLCPSLSTSQSTAGNPDFYNYIHACIHGALHPYSTDCTFHGTAPHIMKAQPFTGPGRVAMVFIFLRGCACMSPGEFERPLRSQGMATRGQHTWDLHSTQHITCFEPPHKDQCTAHSTLRASTCF